MNDIKKALESFRSWVEKLEHAYVNYEYWKKETTANQERIQKLEKDREKLWSILDDISTAADMYKGDLQKIAIYALKRCEERGKIMYSEDGYRLIEKSEEIKDVD